MTDAPAPKPGRLRAALERLKKRNPSFFVYFAARVLASVAGIVIVKFLIAFLDKPTYGHWGYLKAIGAMAVPIVSLSLPAAMMRMYFDRAKDDTVGQASLITTTFLISLASVALLLLAAGGLYAFDGDLNAFGYFGVVTSGTLLTTFFNYLTRMRNDYVLHFVNRVTETVGFMTLVAIAATLAALPDPHPAFAFDHLGWVVGLNAACVWGVALLNTCIYLRRGMIAPRARRLPRDEILALIRFSAPLSVTFFLGWTLSSSDIYLLKKLASLTEVADYVFATGIASFVALITQSALTDWPTYYYGELRDDRPDRDARIASRVRMFLLLHLGAIVIIRLIARFAYDLLGADKYLNGVELIDYLVLGNFFFLLGNILAAGIGYAKKTWLTTLTFALPGALNVGLNLLLIPAWGARAAALTTLLAYALMALLSWLLGRRFYAFTELHKVALIVLLATAAALIPLPF